MLSRFFSVSRQINANSRGKGRTISRTFREITPSNFHGFTIRTCSEFGGGGWEEGGRGDFIRAINRKRSPDGFMTFPALYNGSSINATASHNIRTSSIIVKLADCVYNGNLLLFSFRRDVDLMVHRVCGINNRRIIIINYNTWYVINQRSISGDIKKKYRFWF